MIKKLTSIETLLALFFALFGGAARLSLSPPKERKLISVVGSMVIAGFSGVLVWALLGSRGYDPLIVAAGTGIGGLLGDDILKGIIKIGEKISTDPMGVIEWWRRNKD